MADKLKLIDQYAVRLLESDPNAYSEEWNADYERGFLDAINKALELPTIEVETNNGWISVENRLPENRNQVMVYGLVDSIFQYGVKDEIYIIGRYRKDYHSWWFPVKIDLEVTHWRHLPEPPKGE